MSQSIVVYVDVLCGYKLDISTWISFNENCVFQRKPSLSCCVAEVSQLHLIAKLWFKQ